MTVTPIGARYDSTRACAHALLAAHGILGLGHSLYMDGAEDVQLIGRVCVCHQVQA